MVRQAGGAIGRVMGRCASIAPARWAPWAKGRQALRIAVMLRHIGEKGGIVTYTVNLLEGFARQGGGHCFELLYARAEDMGRFHDQPGFREHLVPAPHKLVWDHWAVPRAARRLGAGLILNPKLSVPLVAGLPRVLVLRPEQFMHPELFDPWDRRYFQWFMPRYCRAAEMVLAPSATAAADIRAKLLVPAGKVAWVHEGVGQHFLAPAPGADQLARVREKYRLPTEYVLFVGGLHPIKNFRRLVEAFALVHPQHRLPLVVAGFNRWNFEQDLSFAQASPVAQHIHFPGFVDDADVPQLYRMARALFYPSIYEGFGIPVAEAMATGCPVVASRRGSSPEVAGGAAVLVDPFDVADMARGLDRVLSETGLGQRLKALGLARAPHFSFDRVAAETLEVCGEARRRWQARQRGAV